tara:strand:+ start:1978 stop:3039 length:1062 start_codon:yes stop_codon:yes gene_type:complete
MNKIISILKEQKSIPIDKFINIALYDKKFGYYIKKNPFGKEGDYITAPLISNLFGEMIAIWCVAFWEYLKKPKKIFIVELGPGDASLCENLLNTFRNFDSFYKSVEIKLLEKSTKLKKIQKNKIKNKKVKWIKDINEVKGGPILFVANEFFDSLPIKQIYKNKNMYFEKHVYLSNKKKIKFLLKKANKKLIKNIKKMNFGREGNTIEYPKIGIEYLKLISQKINRYGGSILVFDYGYTSRKNKDTLQSVKKHSYSYILNEPGKADITHHINYSLFSKILKKNKLQVQKIVSQSEFLQKLGIIERANVLSKNMSFKSKADIFYRLQKLLHYKEMGTLFKVLCAQKKGSKFFLGF